MKSLILFFILIAFTIFSTAQENIKKTNVTVYNNDLGVIREIREMEINKGTTDVKVTGVAEKIDPTSVHINFSGTVLEQNFQYDLISLNKILQKYIDNEIDLISEKDAISGTLLSVSSNSLVIRKRDKGLLLLPDFNKYQISVKSLPEGFITKPTLLWKVISNRQGKQDVELSYQTRGLSWHAEYVAVLDKDDKQIDLKAWVSIDNNSGATYKDAELKLVAGEVNKIKEELVGFSDYRDYAKMESKPMFEEKPFFEYHIYNLQKPTTINNNEIKQISLFEEININVTKKFVYKSYGFRASGNVSVNIEFINSKENRLGMPFPAGKIRLNKSDGHSIEFVGEDMINHTSKDEKISLTIGDAFDLKAEETVKEQKRISNNVQENIYEIKLRNHKTEDVTIEVEKHLGTNWEILGSNFKYENKDATSVIFKIPVPKDKEEVLTIKVRYVN